MLVNLIFRKFQISDCLQLWALGQLLTNLNHKEEADKISKENISIKYTTFYHGFVTISASQILRISYYVVLSLGVEW